MTQKHPFHLVDPSPWPLVMSTAMFMNATGLVMYMHGYKGGGWLLVMGMLMGGGTIGVWLRDVVREGTLEGQHTSMVQLGLRMGMILFIASEVMFFVAFFWAYFWVSLAPVHNVGSVWPPAGIEVLEAWGIPFLNTLILLTSGASVTWAHHGIVAGDRESTLKGLIVTVVLAVVFTTLQWLEYRGASFGIGDGAYGSTFYMATGFHGFHVMMGTVMLTVGLIRIYRYHMTQQHHFGFEAGAWYWHFVDVVWLFLFVAVYWWGG
uniref:Cytochrome c oxidase subunit 3 n=1 Tax=Labyrinthula sp. TaxID=1678526 RepID=A0A7S6U9R6_9STRA|nr:cytochrome c oxidase subunit 3 [Labyrinthula sp.]